MLVVCNHFIMQSLCDACTFIADRKGRHTKQVESHIYHQEPPIDLSERNGSVSSGRSIRSLKHQMSDVSTSSGGKCGCVHASTLVCARQCSANT